jgi:mono/diheme cytochrome c family protein
LKSIRTKKHFAWTSFRLAACLTAVFAIPFPSSVAGATEPISFNNQIQPILSENCFACHGPDSSSRKPKKHPLRLDRETGALEPRDDGKPVIIQGNADASELVRRICATNDDVMPPPSEHKTLKPEQIALIKEWINQGAHYQKQWSLIAPVKAALSSEGEGWAFEPIDHFVARELERHGLALNPQIDTGRLLRRVSFALTGLPPTPEQEEALARDHSPKAWEQAVDRMLDSDACAENFARLWLDAVRYADTQGIHHDHSRSIWPYRDWVIRAYKANMPFDKFTIDQFGGDLLPHATLDEQIASGYNRLLPTTGEGGAIPEEYAAIYAKDRTDNMGAVWLGLTTGCATCHDHKFDPISTKEFYSLTAFFRNSTIPALDDGDSGNTPPVLFVPDMKDRSRWAEIQADTARLKESVAARAREAKPEFDTWMASVTKHSPKLPTHPAPQLELPLTEPEIQLRGAAANQPIVWKHETESKRGPFGLAPLVNGGGIVENAAPSFQRSGQATFGADVYFTGKPNGAFLSRMDKAQKYRGFDLFFSEGKLIVSVIDNFPDAALQIETREPLKAGEWHHVFAVYDGSQTGSAALKCYVDGDLADTEVKKSNLGPNIVANVPFRLGARSDGKGTVDALKGGNVYLQEVQFYNRALTRREIAALAVANLVPVKKGTNELMPLYLAAVDPKNLTSFDRLDALNEESDRLHERGGMTLVMQERTNFPPTAHVLRRGVYTDKQAEVIAATPAALPAMTSDEPDNRLGLGRWLVSTNNPLTARVTMNRLWAHFFGTGIVETTEDFGVMGARPVNQDLLDWLAVDFMEHNWDFRRMAKMMVMSRAFRQSETVTAERLAKDPSNRLCSRGPRGRLDAEEIRDQALAASGLLAPKIGGPSVKPYQPPGVWEAVAMESSNTRHYVQDHGDSLYRRSVYTFWKRVAPPASMEILNAPSREVACTRREVTDTPLQTLVTLNDPQFVEAARNLAQHAMRTGPTFDQRLDQITERLISRRMTTLERGDVKKFEQSALANFRANPGEADALIKTGESPIDPALPHPEMAAWTLVASEVMNLDESLTK